MRLLEKRVKLEAFLVDGKIEIKQTQAYSGYGYHIENGRALFDILFFLSKEDWNHLDFTPIRAMIDKYSTTSAGSVTIDQSEYGTLFAYVNELNQRLPIFMGILEGMTEKQDVQDINVKLSSIIDEPKKLESLIKKINSLSKVANIDGEAIQFKGFDKGSDWITLGVAGSVTYFLIVRCLKLAQEICKTQQEYFKSKTAELDYRASLTGNNKYTEKGQADYEKRRIEIQKNYAIDELAKKIGNQNGFVENEVRVHAQQAVDSLISIIGDGNEVHLSLNPPKEVTESPDGVVDIDYSFLNKLKPIEKKKELGTGNLKGKAEE